MTEVYWFDKAKKMRDAGYSYSQIGRAVGRTAGRVHHVLNPKEYTVKKSRVRIPDSEQAKWRRNRRLWCRRTALRTGENVQMLYERYDCGDLDRATLWDERS